MHRLTASTLKAWRDAAVTQQGGRCALCGDPFTASNPAVGDHHHKTGLMRAALHRGCNAALGHVENNAPRYFLTAPVRLHKWAKSLASYIHRDWGDAPYHPTHRTAEEKVARTKKLAAKRRAAKKATT